MPPYREAQPVRQLTPREELIRELEDAGLRVEALSARVTYNSWLFSSLCTAAGLIRGVTAAIKARKEG